jgi:formate transporter
MNETLTPAEITAKSTEVAVEKTSKPLYKILINGILAGMFIGIGAMFSINSISGLEALPYGLVKLIAGLAFSIGLILVMIAGAELFTGDALMITARLDRKISLGKWIKNLSLIRISNFIGALILIGLLLLAGRDTFNGGNITTTILSLGEKKMHYGFLQAMSLGILCNILVCLGVRLARAGKRAVDKIAGMVFPVTAFVACGFEHSVANMFYLPFAYFLGLDASIGEIFLHNLLPVTIGNIIGGAIFVGLLYWVLYHKKS